MLSLAIGLLGWRTIKQDVIDRAQNQVRNNLFFAREIYQGEVNNVFDIVRFTAARYFLRDALIKNDPAQEVLGRFGMIRQEESLDILSLTDARGVVIARARNPAATGDDQSGDEMVSRVLAHRKPVSGTVIVPAAELARESPELAEQARIMAIDTPRSKPGDEPELTGGMMIKAACPVFDYENRLIGVVYGGTLMNRRHAIVDRVKAIVFQDAKYDGKDVGNATIFQDDLRIATNVLNEDGTRAVGTRVSEDVYRQVIERGLPWIGRAFVVNDWYKTAYEPIRNTGGKVIGMLYVGTLKKPFDALARNTTIAFLLIAAAVAVLSLALSLFLAACVSKPLNNLLNATVKLSSGELGHMVEARTGVTELDQLAGAFNAMSAKLDERDRILSVSNNKLEMLNKNYIDLIGFVSHELKGILASIIMNVCSVHDGFFGALNEKQKNALGATMRNLDYLTATVKKFLNLGKIEKGELKLNCAEVKVRDEVFERAINAHMAVAARKGMQIANNVPGDLSLRLDPELMQIVAGNLITNAIKYGEEYGDISISARLAEESAVFEVYNDSTPLTAQQQERLFKRFARLDNQATRKEKGTGLGLFIAKEIVRLHGGKIWTEAREKGNAFLFEIARSPDRPAHAA